MEMRQRSHNLKGGLHRQSAGTATDGHAASYEMWRRDMSCPDCHHPSLEVLELPDGRATYCPQCGYRGVEEIRDG